jgi:hypothetical protein
MLFTLYLEFINSVFYDIYIIKWGGRDRSARTSCIRSEPNQLIGSEAMRCHGIKKITGIYFSEFS